LLGYLVQLTIQLAHIKTRRWWESHDSHHIRGLIQRAANGVQPCGKSLLITITLLVGKVHIKIAIDSLIKQKLSLMRYSSMTCDTNARVDHLPQRIQNRNGRQRVVHGSGSCQGCCLLFSPLLFQPILLGWEELSSKLFHF
jgi:hypothetical protein